MPFPFINQGIKGPNFVGPPGIRFGDSPNGANYPSFGFDVPTPDGSAALAHIGPENLLPRWMVASAPGSGLLYNLLRPIAAEGDRSREALLHNTDAATISTCPIGDTRKEWYVPLPSGFNGRLTATLLLNNVSITLKEVKTPYELENATEPIFYCTNGKIIFRALAMREIVYTGHVDHTYDIVSDDVSLLPDVDIYWRRQDEWLWHRVDAETYTPGSTQFTLPVNGDLVVRYASQTRNDYLSTATITLTSANASSIALTPVSGAVPTKLDSFGLLLSLPRLDDEDSLSYKKRLIALALLPLNSTREGVRRGIALSLKLLTQLTWDGIGDLEMPARTLGAILVESAQEVTIEEDLLPQDTLPATTWLASRSNWLPHYEIKANGSPVQASVSGAAVVLTTPVSGTVSARYRVTVASPITSGDEITYLTAPYEFPEMWNVLTSQDVDLFALGQSSIIEDKLLDSSGIVNSLGRTVAETIKRGNPILVGRAGWDTLIPDAPLEMSYLPLPLDTIEITT